LEPTQPRSDFFLPFGRKIPSGGLHEFIRPLDNPHQIVHQPLQRGVFRYQIFKVKFHSCVYKTPLPLPGILPPAMPSATLLNHFARKATPLRVGLPESPGSRGFTPRLDSGRKMIFDKVMVSTIFKNAASWAALGLLLAGAPARGQGLSIGYSNCLAVAGYSQSQMNAVTNFNWYFA